MKKMAFIFVSLVVSMSASAAEVICQPTNPSEAIVTKITATGGTISIQDSNNAKVFYAAMESVQEELMTSGVPEGTVMYRKIGKSITCFKQVLDSCLSYQCNVLFQDFKTGQVGSPL